MTVVFVMVMLHSPDGREIDVSVDEITAIHCRIPDKENRLFADGVNAIINLTDGKNVPVSETCSEIRDMLKAANK